MRVVILGGGFAGVACAGRLQRRRDVEVTLVARENYATFQPLLADVIGGSIEPRHVVNALRRLLPKTRVMQSEIEAIDLAARRVRLRPRQELAADHLVLALGMETDFSHVPGLAEHGLPLRTLGDAFAIRTTLVARLEAASVAERPGPLMTFVVIGGGFSGVEVAGQIRDFLKSALASYPRLAGMGRVVLVQRGDNILEELDARLSAFALEKLRARGVEVELGKGVTAVTAHGVRLDDGREIAAATVVSTVGNTPHPLLGGRVETDACLRVPGHDDVWAAGDCAAVPAPNERGVAPQMAQWAVREGDLLARNIGAVIDGRSPRPFTFKGLGQLASLGHRAGVAQIFGFRFAGRFAWWLWRTVYLLKLPGIDRRLRVMFDWTLDLFFPRDLVALDMKRSGLVGRVHYEPGDVLFGPGDPSETFYVIESGAVEIDVGKGERVRLGPGQHFGERSLDLGAPHSATARAAEPTTLLTVGRVDFSALTATLDTFGRAMREALERTRGGPDPPLPPEIERTVGDRPVREVMSAPALTIEAKKTLGDALRAILDERRGFLPVLDGDGLAGVVTRTTVYGALDRRVALSTPLGDLLDPRVVTVSADATVAQAAEILRRENLKRLVVLDGDRVAGVVSRLDLFRAHLRAT